MDNIEKGLRQAFQKQATTQVPSLEHHFISLIENEGHVKQAAGVGAGAIAAIMRRGAGSAIRQDSAMRGSLEGQLTTLKAPPTTFTEADMQLPKMLTQAKMREAAATAIRDRSAQVGSSQVTSELRARMAAGAPSSTPGVDVAHLGPNPYKFVDYTRGGGKASFLDRAGEHLSAAARKGTAMAEHAAQYAQAHPEMVGGGVAALGLGAGALMLRARARRRRQAKQG